jgi:phosphoserine phosphatase
MPSRTLQLAAGDILGLITDGIYEYENESREQFGMDRVAALVRAHRDIPMEHLLLTLRDAAATFGGTAPQLDDITIVLLHRQREHD